MATLLRKLLKKLRKIKNLIFKAEILRNTEKLIMWKILRIDLTEKLRRLTEKREKTEIYEAEKGVEILRKNAKRAEKILEIKLKNIIFTASLGEN